MAHVKRQSFVHGAAVLAAAGIIVKIIGAFFKIPLGAILGPEGMANFSIAYNIYALLFVLSTAGVPVAVSKMISESVTLENYSDMRRIYKVSYISFAIVGGVCFAVMYFGAPAFAKFMGSPDASVSIRAIAPAVMFVAISGINRGYFQGRSNMYPTAISEVVEAVGKLVIGLGAALWLKKSGFDDSVVSAGAVLGVSAGALLSALYFAFFRDGDDYTNSPCRRRKRDILNELMHLAVPITLGAAVMSLTNVIDSALVMNLLQKTGFTMREAKWLYGSYNYSANLFNLPSTLVTTISIALIPAVSGAYVRKSFKELEITANSAIKLAMLVAVPSAAGLFALSHPILRLLYEGSVEQASIKVAGDMLSMLAIAVPFLAVVSLTNSIHQSLGRANYPVFSMICGALVKFLSNAILVSNPKINIYGAPISTVLCYFTIALLNIVGFGKYPFVKLKYSKIFIKPTIAGVCTGAAAGLFQKYAESFLNARFLVVLSVLAGVLTYIFCVSGLDVLDKNDKKLIFRDKKIFNFLKND